MRRLVEYGFCAGMMWEIVALLTHRVPTVTAVIHATRGWPPPAYAASVAVVVGGLIYAGWHLLVGGEW